MIDFALSDAQKQAREGGARVCQRFPSKWPLDIYAQGPNQQERYRSTRSVFRQAVAAGLIKGQVPPALGGTSGSMIDVAILLEELYGADPSVTVTIVGTGLGLAPLLLSGNEALQKEYIQPFLKDEANWLEKGGKGLQTTAEKDGDTWVINGEKLWTTNSGGWGSSGADLSCLVCRQTAGGAAQDPASDPAESIIIFLVTRETIAANKESAYHVLSEPELMSHPAVTGPQTKLTDFRIPDKNVLVAGKDAASLINQSFTPTAALVGIMAVSIARRAFEAALAFAKSDSRSGSVPIIQRPSVADLLTNINIRPDAIRLICWKALHCLENGPGTFSTRQEICLEAKIFATDSCVDCVTDAMEAVGMQAYRKDLPFVKLLNDAMCMPLFDGGNIGFRKRQMEKIFQMDDYQPWASFYDIDAEANGAPNGH